MRNGSRYFIQQFLKHPIQVGAIVPSSRRLARMLVGWPDLENARAVVEYGAGTGVFSQAIVDSISKGCRFFGIEVDHCLAMIARRRLPHLTIYEDSVAHVRALRRKAGIDQLDCVVSGLPWVSFSALAQREFMDAMMSVLRPGGQFVTFSYLHCLLLPPGQRFAQLLPEYFSEVSRSKTVWLNLPPAFVYQCKR